MHYIYEIATVYREAGWVYRVLERNKRTRESIDIKESESPFDYQADALNEARGALADHLRQLASELKEA